MTTQLQIQLSQGFQDTLTGLSNGVNVYAVYFTNGGKTANWLAPSQGALVLDGTNGLSTPIAFDFPTTTNSKGEIVNNFPSGKIYFLIQSLTAGDQSDLTTLITEEADIGWSNPATSATTLDYRYDSIELNLVDGPDDQGNLTSVNGFGIPMTLSNGTDTRSYGLSAEDIFQKVIQASTSQASQDYLFTAGTAPGTPGGLLNQQRVVMSPTTAVGGNGGATPPFSAGDWNTYVTSLQGAAASDIVLSGWFNGAPDANHVWHNAGFFSYQMSWDGTYFWLKPTQNSQVLGDIRITPANLESSIYSTLGSADIFMPDGTTSYLSGMNSGANNQWGEILKQLITGFVAGYYGATATSPNALVPGSVDLDKSWNWDPSFAFGGGIVLDSAGHLTNAAVTPSTHVHYDDYAKVFFQHSNSYGNGYSDNLMAALAQGGPLLSLSDPTTGKNVPLITVTLHADGETPTGYVQPVMYNYLAPSGADYSSTYVAGGANSFTFALANESVVVTDGTPISFGWYTGTDGSGHATFTDLALPSGSIYRSFTLVPDGSGSFTWSSAVNSGTFGSIVVTGVPMTSDGGVGWYRLTVGSGSAAKTFNIYAQSDPTTHLFVNPNATPGAAQVDGLGIAAGATNPAPPTVNGLNISMLSSSGFGLDSSLVSRLTVGIDGNASFPTPSNPVLGTLSGETFTQFQVPGASGFTVDSDGTLAFGWWGADEAYVQQQASLPTPNYVVAQYTNKVSALNVAHITFSSASSYTSHIGIRATGDLDGNWVGTGTFGNGTYNAVMTEYTATDHGYLTPIAKTSQNLIFTVDLTQLDFMNIPGADYLQLDPAGTSVSGNWIKLQTNGSNLPNGTLLLYATDDSGNLIGRDGETGPGVTLEDAVLARIGSVAFDNGSSMMHGAQAVWLPVGQQLHFAIQTGDDVIEQLPGVQISGSGALSVSVSGRNGTLALTATIDNTLSNDASLAESQRQSDEPWIYLNQGQNVHVEVAGSAFNINTIHLVHIDVDSKGDWSVGGVAYGDTDAFRNAVQNNWDPGFVASGGRGNFRLDHDWTASKGSGFYAPVLVTEHGDIFVIGNANVDGQDHIRMFGENTFGFEDLRADQHSDFDYNDLVMKVWMV